MTKIVYLMDIDWDWIKQRPQFIAEGLSQFHEVHVLCRTFPITLITKSAHKTKANNVNVHRFYALPFSFKKGIYFINKLYLKLYFWYFLKKHNPEFLWIPFPILYDFIPKNKYKIIYDCMDDYTEFEFNNYYNNRIKQCEEKLINDSLIIFTSSQNLYRNLNEKYTVKVKDKIFIIRNAFDGLIFKNNDDEIERKFPYKIGYVGSISSWFDFEILEKTLKKFKEIEYHIIGPVYKEVSGVTTNKRIIFHGPVEHDKLYSYIKDYDCMVMPFKLNDLVSSVDPVKLYEYINYDKPIISICYDEVKRFSPFVYFYSDEFELMGVLSHLIEHNFPKKYSEEERIRFLEKNTWKKRISQILERIQIINSKKDK
jgi:teichuronic acid biosynthesis glycosyltransferase TuaH